MLQRCISFLSKNQILIHGIWAIPCVLIIRLIGPFKCVRFCEIRSERIGHFVSDIAEHICRNYELDKKYIDFFYFKKISNLQWEKMAKRSPLNICNSWVQYIDRWNKKIPGGKFHSIPSSFTLSRDSQGLISKYDCKLDFLPEEQKICENWLMNKGWTPGEAFVVFLIRDTAFQDQFLPKSRNWDYHNYRNSEIKTYIPAMDWLTQQGVWVLRMGKIAKDPLNINNKFIIDYATNQDGSDLLDIWLFANSNAIISTGSGLDYLGGIYRVPILLINYLPLSYLYSFFAGICVPKKLFWKNNGIQLSISQMLSHSFLRSEDYLNKEIEIQDLNENEIMSNIVVFWSIFGIGEKPSDKFLQTNFKFWELLEKDAAYLSVNLYRHPNSFISDLWLKEIGFNNLK
jgi:putative glycosyltransferase (TIGR04372 family)